MNKSKVRAIYILEVPPSLYLKIQIFLKLVLDMFSTSKVMQIGNVATCRHVSLMHHWFMSFWHPYPPKDVKKKFARKSVKLYYIDNSLSVQLSCKVALRSIE